MSRVHNIPPTIAEAAAAAEAAAVAAKSAQPVEKTLKVVMYRRVNSDSESDKRYSLAAQVRLLTAYIVSHPGWVATGNYVERASAKNVTGHLQLPRLLDAAASGKFDLILGGTRPPLFAQPRRRAPYGRPSLRPFALQPDIQPLETNSAIGNVPPWQRRRSRVAPTAARARRGLVDPGGLPGRGPSPG